MALQAGYNLKASDGTTAQHALGDEMSTKGGAVWKYVKAAEAISAYQLCHIAADGTILKSTTTLVGTAARPTELCIPQFDIASGEYAWVPVGPFKLREDGVSTFKVAALINCAGSVKLYTTATSGSVDDSVTTGVVQGLALSATITAATNAACVAVTRLTSFCDT